MSQKMFSSVNDKGNVFGGRVLTDPNAVFEFNAWDHVEWDEEQKMNALAIVEKQLLNPMDKETAEKLEQNADKLWNAFYEKHDNKFFKDRNWFKIEFPELFNTPENKDHTFKIWEVGCGAGNSVFPLLRHHRESNTHIFCSDFSSSAVNIVKANPEFDSDKCTCFVYDITNSELPGEIQKNEIDIIVAVFVLSAIHPSKIQHTLRTLVSALKPGGLLLIRDYAPYDLTHLRFKSKRCISPNFCARGDGTQVHYMSTDVLTNYIKLTNVNENGEKIEGISEIIQCALDTRMLVNRAKRLKMYRMWIQGKFRK